MHHDANGGELIMALSWAETVERVTRIELALSAWESDRSGADRPADQPGPGTASTRAVTPRYCG